MFKIADTPKAVGPTVSSVPEIPHELERLCNCVETLHSLVDNLHAKLNPVMSSAPPQPPADIAAKECNTPIGNIIRRQANEIYGAVDRLRYLLEQTQL